MKKMSCVRLVAEVEHFGSRVYSSIPHLTDNLVNHEFIWGTLSYL